MDFADATFVYLAERDLLSTFPTVDIAEFPTYKIEGSANFDCFPVFGETTSDQEASGVNSTNPTSELGSGTISPTSRIASKCSSAAS